MNELSILYFPLIDDPIERKIAYSSWGGSIVEALLQSSETHLAIQVVLRSIFDTSTKFFITIRVRSFITIRVTSYEFVIASLRVVIIYRDIVLYK